MDLHKLYQPIPDIITPFSLQLGTGKWEKSVSILPLTWVGINLSFFFFFWLTFIIFMSGYLCFSNNL